MKLAPQFTVIVLSGVSGIAPGTRWIALLERKEYESAALYGCWMPFLFAGLVHTSIRVG
jgi:hypothetical protein